MTKASFDTAAGILCAAFFATAAMYRFKSGDWRHFIFDAAAALFFLRMFIRGYARLPDK